MKVEVSNGELMDKLSILELKLKNITDSKKLINIKVEFNELNPLVQKLFKKYNPALGISTLSKDTSSLNQLYWKPTIYYAVISAIGLAVLITLIQGESEFLYFQF